MIARKHHPLPPANLLESPGRRLVGVKCHLTKMLTGPHFFHPPLKEGMKGPPGKSKLSWMLSCLQANQAVWRKLMLSCSSGA